MLQRLESPYEYLLVKVGRARRDRGTIQHNSSSSLKVCSYWYGAETERMADTGNSRLIEEADCMPSK